MILGYEIIKFDSNSPKYHLFNNTDVWKFNQSLCGKYVLGREVFCEDEEVLDVLDCHECIEIYKEERIK